MKRIFPLIAFTLLLGFAAGAAQAQDNKQAPKLETKSQPVQVSSDLSVKASVKPKRIALSAGQSQALAQADAALSDADVRLKILQGQVNGLVAGLGISVIGLDWQTKYRLIKDEDGKYAFDELPPPAPKPEPDKPKQ